MHRKSPLFALTAALAASVSLPAHAEMMFNRIASFAVADNLPADIEKATPTSSEIITASEDGNTLVYSDSPLGAVGFIDITDAKSPKAGGIETDLAEDGLARSHVMIFERSEGPATYPMITAGSDQAPRLQAEGQGMVGSALSARQDRSRLGRSLRDHRP